MTRYSTGLVVGKFAPLHRGHELLIRAALGACERVLVLSWAKPELPQMEPERRERWLAALFPETERLVLTQARLTALAPPPELATLPGDDTELELQRRLCAWLCERVFQARPDAVFTSESYGVPWAEEMSRWFGRRVEPVLVDPARARVPISGTRLRADVHAHREFLSPEVYRDFVSRVVLLGGESTGKSTLAERLAAELQTLHVPELGRELWEARGGQLEFDDLVRIGREQVAREEAALERANAWLVCDTSPLTTLLYSRALFGRADPELEALAERRYDRVVLCAADFPFVQDGTRRDETFRQRQQAWYRAELEARAVAWVEAGGSLEQRIRRIRAAL
jgi:HTH-type transcriptional regulator, transcriptional repressor of NAD biosynthesis genes